MESTGSTASNEYAFKNILKTCPNGEKNGSKVLASSSSCSHN